MLLKINLLIIALLMNCAALAGDLGDPVQDTDNAPSQMLANSAACKAGHGAGTNNCYKAVKQIIASGLGKDLNCLRNNFLTSGSAADAYDDLQKVGFVDDRSKCNEKGTVLVYKGIYDGMSPSQVKKSRGKNRHKQKISSGDFNGHVEVIGSDSQYHYYQDSSRPITQTSRVGNRRELIGCMVISQSALESSPINSCKNSRANLCHSGSKRSGSGKRSHSHTGGT